MALVTGLRTIGEDDIAVSVAAAIDSSISRVSPVAGIGSSLFGPQNVDPAIVLANEQGMQGSQSDLFVCPYISREKQIRAVAPGVGESVLVIR